MQIAHEITSSEREAVKRHLFCKNDKLSDSMICKLLYKYEISLENKINEITDLKMSLDDREIAIKLFLSDKLNENQLRSLVSNGH